MSWLGPVCCLVVIFAHFQPLYSNSTRQTDITRKFLEEAQGRHRHGTRRGGDGIFRAIWDVPNSCKDDFGIDIPLDEFGIEFNKNHQWYSGDVLNVFNHLFGRYPYVDETGKFINGGLPQLTNITQHLEKVADDILYQIPDPDYEGLAMIDWENWYPSWSANEQQYRTYSINHVRNLHPWDNATIETVAELEWTEGAKLFMESTLKLAKQLRPNALWGYYHYPYCMVSGNDSKCRPDQPGQNDEIMWLFNESTIIYPSIYLKPKQMPYPKSSVEGRLSEAFRIREKSSDPKGPVMSYTRFNYSSTDFYFSLEDLNNTILTSAEFGTHGVIFWGDNYDDRTAQVCLQLKDYVTKALGPTVVLAREGAEACSARVCSGRGRCVGEILTCSKSNSENISKGKGKRQNGPRGVCSCRCFVGWGGKDCRIKTKY